MLCFRKASPSIFPSCEVLSVDMLQQRHTFILLPQKWKQSPDLFPTSCPIDHFFSFHLKSSRPTSVQGLSEFLLVLLASLCFLPCPAWAVWFRVGVVGPWGCDPLFAKALPNVAAQLAVNRINRDPSLAYAATFDYAVLQVRQVLASISQVNKTHIFYPNQHYAWKIR